MMVNQNPVVACITAQKGCQRIIETARTIANELSAPLQVLNVQNTSHSAVEYAENLECLYKLAKACNAEITIYYDNEPARITASHVLLVHAVHIVTGMPDEDGDFLARLHSAAPRVPITLVDDAAVYILPSGPSVKFCPVQKGAQTRPRA